MPVSLVVVAASTPSMVLRYAAAFFLIAVAIGLVFALIRLGKTLSQAERMMGDVNNEVVPLLKQATETLDGVNTELEKLDTVMGTVVDVTEKVDATTRAVEAAVTVPAKKAAAFGAGVSQAVSSLFGRHERGTPDDDFDSSWDRDRQHEAAPWATSSSAADRAHEPASEGSASAGPADDDATVSDQTDAGPAVAGDDQESEAEAAQPGTGDADTSPGESES